jgi:NAD(P)-dependent dehydrogenase (short-subunit alcohol dehydrogenase family)
MAATAFITGCSSGLGAASARLFAERGWNVVATMRDVADGAELVALDNVLLVRLDVQDRCSIDAAVATGIERFGRIDALINNAGFGLHGVFESTPREKVLEQFEVNVFGVMDVTRAILPHFRANKAGSIVNVSSGAGVFTLPMISLYLWSLRRLSRDNPSLLTGVFNSMPPCGRCQLYLCSQIGSCSARRSDVG